MDVDRLQSQTVAWLRYPLMVLIVIIHTDSALLSSMPNWGVSETVFCMLRTVVRVAVPLFFIFSGYWFFRQPEEFTLESYKEKISKRVRTLLVPYLLWNIFAWLLHYVIIICQGHAEWITIRQFHPDKLADLFFGFGEGYSGMPKAFQLWFLRDLMVVCLLAPQLYMLLKHRRTAIVTLLCFTALYLAAWNMGWHPILNRFPSALLFFSVGAYLGIHKENMVEAARKVPVWISVTVPTLLMCWNVWLLMHSNPAYLYAESLFSIAATVPTLQVAAWLVEKHGVKPVKWLSGSAFLLFAVHPLIIQNLVAEPLMGCLEPSRLHFWLVLTAEVAVPVVLCAILHRLAVRFMPHTASLFTGNRK